MNTRKLFLTSLLAAATMSATAWADVTPIDTSTYDSGAYDISLAGAVDTLNVASSGTVTLAGDLTPKTESGSIAINMKSSGGLVFALADGSTETTFSYDIGTLSTVNGVRADSASITINEGVTVNATAFSNGWGLKELTVDGELNVSGTFQYGTGGVTNTISGNGTISAERVDLGNCGTYDISGVTLKVGSGGIVHDNNWGYTAKFGAMTILATANFTVANAGTTSLADSTTGTTFDTNGNTVTVNQVLGGDGKLRKTGEGTLSLTGNNTYSGGTIVEAGKLSLASTGTISGNVEISGGELELAGKMKISAENQISFTGTSGTLSVVTESVIFDLASSLFTNNAVTLAIASGSGTFSNWDQLKVKNFIVGGAVISGRSEVNSSTNGQVSITLGTAANLVWAGTAAENGNIWDANNAGNKIWTNSALSTEDKSDAFYMRDNVTFNDAAANKNVSIGGNLTVGTITVSVDGYTFSATDNATIASGAITVSATNGLTLEAAQDKTLTLSGEFANGSNKVVEITKTGAGAAVVSNAANKIAKVTVSAGTLELYGETSDEHGKGVESFNVASGATLSIRSNDMARWSSAASYDISGTLALNDKRVSIGESSNGDLFKLNGGTITGTGEGDNGALDFFDSRVVNVTGESTISAKTRLRGDAVVTLNVAEGASLALTGDVFLKANAAGSIEKSGKGTATISSGTKSFTALTVSGGTLNITGGTTSTTDGTTVGNGGVLVLGAVSTAASYLRGVLAINDGGTVKLTGGDATGYGNREGTDTTDVIYKLVINKGGVLEIGTDATQSGQNQTFNMKDGIVLQGGKITAKNGVSNAKFDLFNTNTTTAGVTTLASDTTAVISADIGLRKKGSFDVASGTTADGVDLLVSGRLTSRAQFTVGDIWEPTLTKSGAGTMKLTGDNQYWTSGGSVTEGTLIAASTTALGKGGTISVSENATLGFVAGTTVDMMKTTTTDGVTTTTNGAIQLARGAEIVVDMLGQDANQEKIVLDLVSGVALSYNSEAVTADNVDRLLGSAISLKNWDEGWTQSLSYSGNTLRLTLTIPEPSTFGLLAGLGALALAGTRRRRKKA